MSAPPISVAEALTWAAAQLRATSDTSRLDAELLLAHVLGWSRARVLAERRAPLSEAQQAAFRDLVARRATLEPIAYLIGHREFYGLDFIVDHHVLIPRPETELLVEHAIAVARRMTTDQGDARQKAQGRLKAPVAGRSSPVFESERMAVADHSSPDLSGGEGSVVVADIGAGSGCIAVALAIHLPGALVYAVDISSEALGVAQRNVERHGVVGRVRLIKSDLLDALPEPVDILVSNPPYTILSAIDAGVRRHEPHLALDGGAEGLDVYRRLLAAAPAKLRPGGAVLLEIGATQGAAVADLARMHFPAARIEVYQDVAGLDRVVVVAT
jgi:release factor glutamine methyltransferase